MEKLRKTSRDTSRKRRRSRNARNSKCASKKQTILSKICSCVCSYTFIVAVLTALVLALECKHVLKCSRMKDYDLLSSKVEEIANNFTNIHTGYKDFEHKLKSLYTDLPRLEGQIMMLRLLLGNGNRGAAGDKDTSRNNNLKICTGPQCKRDATGNRIFNTSCIKRSNSYFGTGYHRNDTGICRGPRLKNNRDSVRCNSMDGCHS